MIKLVNFYLKNKKVIFLTFEIFWIIVFILEMTANKSGTHIPQFVYVNY